MTGVSVLIPSFNGRAHLETCLASLQACAGVGEVIVFDNGSSDGSAAWVRRHFPHVRLLAEVRNLGFAGALNAASRSASGEWLAFLNNDMRVDSGWVSQALEAAGTHGCVASRILDWSGERIDFDGSSLQYLGFAEQEGRGEPVSHPGAARPLLFPCGGAMFVRRALFQESGGFDERYFAVYEDVDFGWRLWLQGHEVLLAPRSVAYHRGHATLDSRAEEKKRFLMHRNALFTIIKNYGEEAFRRVVPLAFFLAVRRAVRFAGVDKSAFYFWEERRLPEDPAALWMLRDAVNHLVALDDVIEAWPDLMASREAVQKSRRRADEEILSRFGDPFRRIFRDLSYEQSEAEWLEHLGVTRLFPEAAPFGLGASQVHAQARRIRELQRELSLLHRRVDRDAATAAPVTGRILGLARRLRRLAGR